MAGEDSLANGFILSLLDTEDTAAQEFLQKWVAVPCTTFDVEILLLVLLLFILVMLYIK